MIESEEKRARLKDLIEHWAKHTKADQMLREGDIPNLVGQVIEEFYHVRLSCGHYVRSIDDGHPMKYKDVNGKVYGTYCDDCSIWYREKLKATDVLC